MIKLSKRLKGLDESVTLAITAKARELKAAGRDIIGFGAGEPDFDTPENIKEAGILAIRSGQTKYTPVAGIVELKDAIRAKFERDNGLKYSREEIIVSCGGKHSLYNLFQAILNANDEVIIPAPYWVSYPVMVQMGGGKAKIVKTKASEGFKMTAKAFTRAVNAKTKAVIINSPSNPTGAAYTEAELKEIAAIALKKNVLIISDEIYEKLTYGGFKAVSIASTSNEARDNCVIVNGVSKTYSMTGWRIGYTAGPAPIIKAMGNIQSQSTSNPTSMSQWAAVEAIKGDQGFIIAMTNEFEARRDEMVSSLSAIKGVIPFNPQGAFYVFADVSALYGRSYAGRKIKNSVDFSTVLLDESGVAVIPGAPFGNDDFIRLSYAVSMKNIVEGVRRIAEFAGKLK